MTCSKQNPRCERRRWRLSRGRPVKALLSQGEVVGFARCLQCQRRQIKARRLPASRGSVCEALVHKRRFTGRRRQTGSSRSFQRARVPQTNVLFPRGSLPPTLPIPLLPLLHHPFPLVSPYPPHIPPLPSSCLITPPPPPPPSCSPPPLLLFLDSYRPMRNTSFSVGDGLFLCLVIFSVNERVQKKTLSSPGHRFDLPAAPTLPFPYKSVR